MSHSAKDPFKAFLPYPPLEHSHRDGPLGAYRFCVKDLFDAKGYPTGCGQPHVLARSGIKARNAAMVQDLIDQGARLIGKTHMVEMAYALTGRNVHFGTPINPMAPDRLPGGSSSGSAAAVAGRLADIGLSTDTLGSIRVPGSYCGLHGLRPSHGALSLEGASPLAPSLDTGGWLTRDGATLMLLTDLFLNACKQPLPSPLQFRVPLQLTQSLEPEVRSAFGECLKVIEANIAPVETLTLPEEDIIASMETIRIIQAYEAWDAHGAMILDLKPQLGPGIADRFDFASKVTRKDYLLACERRDVLSARHSPLLDTHVLILPSAPGPAPLRRAPDAELEGHRTALIRQLSFASLLGVPEITLPLLKPDGLPVGVSLIGRRGSDQALARLGARISEDFRPSEAAL